MGPQKELTQKRESRSSKWSRHPGWWLRVTLVQVKGDARDGMSVEPVTGERHR